MNAWNSSILFFESTKFDKFWKISAAYLFYLELGYEILILVGGWQNKKYSKFERYWTLFNSSAFIYIYSDVLSWRWRGPNWWFDYDINYYVWRYSFKHFSSAIFHLVNCPHIVTTLRVNHFVKLFHAKTLFLQCYRHMSVYRLGFYSKGRWYIYILVRQTLTERMVLAYFSVTCRFWQQHKRTENVSCKCQLHKLTKA